ncbi:Serum paraoxonase/arylesterase 2 [Podila epicladia]|nr:Serum paraoxonase/arylesterase 2 [Podila epicladia]KAG0099168.1 Serum paraoxonase/arylesterase 2 [Podila epicladia]
MSEQEPKSTLRSRRTTVEDASDDSDTATTTATSALSSSKAKTKEAKESSTTTKKGATSTTTTTTTTTTTGASQSEAQKPSQLRNLLLSLIIASLGVVLMSAYNKFVLPTREITIEQSVGLQGNCFQIADIPGPAAIEIDDRDKLAFVSSDDRSWKQSSRFFHRPSSKTELNGGIYTLRLSQKHTSPKECKLKGYTYDDFHPAGMSLFQYQDDSKAWINRLFVINHSHKGDVVELFDYSPATNSLTFVKRIESSLFVTPKDIVAVDQDRFYLTNQHGMAVKYGRVVEDLAGLALGSVVYYNGKTSFKVLESLANPYGIAISPDATQLYISAFSERSVHVYNMTEDIEVGELVHDVDIWVGNHVDNLSVDKHTGDLYVASHPSYSTYLRHSLGYEPQSPSHVVKIEKLSPENYIHQKSSQPEFYFFPTPELPPLKWEVKDLFYSNGEDISGTYAFYAGV